VFLITVGMSLDLGVVWDQPGAILLARSRDPGAKAMVTGLLLRLMGARPGTSTEAGILMSSPSETTLIVLGAAISARADQPRRRAVLADRHRHRLTVTPILALDRPPAGAPGR
jgi:CPA2 family monovalent cation:H+ antiporter-2